MIRLSVLALVVITLMVYAWRDWYRSLCGLIVLTSILNHPDVPRSMLGVSGLSPFNIMLLNNLAAWSSRRSSERLRFNLPGHVAVLLLSYLLVILVAFARMMVDRSMIGDIPTLTLWIDRLMNPVKWVIPGLLLFDGARTPERVRWGLSSTLFIYLVLALQVIKAMPLGAIAQNVYQLQHLASRLVLEYTGYSRVNLSMMLAGGAWAMIAARSVVRRWWGRLLVLAAFVLTTYGQALTAGRAGYATWAVLALVFGVLKWRRYLLLAPLIIAAVITIVPSTVDRFLTGIKEDPERSETTYGDGGAGIGGDSGRFDDEGGVDEEAVTAGRSLIWPVVVAKIGESPVYGYGMEAMRRTGLAVPEFGHPHNAYLEILLDGGWISLIPVVLFYLVIVFKATRLFVSPRSPLEEASGGVALALTLALLVAGMGSQHFYPQTGSLGMWAAIGLMLRASVNRQRQAWDRAHQSLTGTKSIGAEERAASM
jgi:O-antigen ligase